DRHCVLARKLRTALHRRALAQAGPAALAAETLPKILHAHERAPEEGTGSCHRRAGRHRLQTHPATREQIRDTSATLPPPAAAQAPESPNCTQRAFPQPRKKPRGPALHAPPPEPALHASAAQSTARAR